MPTPRSAALAACLALSLTAPSLADELKLFEQHELEGVEGGTRFTGHVEFHTDATYTGQREFADGRREALSGRVRIEGKAFVLDSGSSGIVATIGVGSTAGTQTYARQDGKQYRWRYDDPADADHEVLTLPCKEHKSRAVSAILFRIGSWNWLLNHNLGHVDDESGLEIIRSRQPEPKHIQKYKRRFGIKTVLSLNGEQDDEVEVERNGQKVKLPMQDYLRQEGLENFYVGMSSRRVATDAELVAVFRVLLDDSKKPILLHCTGGADRTGIIAALYQVEFMGRTKKQARKSMRRHMWTAHEGTEIQGAYLDLYQPGRIRTLLQNAGVTIPARYRQP